MNPEWSGSIYSDSALTDMAIVRDELRKHIGEDVADRLSEQAVVALYRAGRLS